MKKILVLLLVIVLLLAGCSGGGDDDGILEIGERFFVEQMTDINMNADDHIGRVIRYEGMFRTIHWPATGEDYHMVLRRTLGCCGDDGVIGYEVYLGGIAPFEEDAWVEVTGMLEWYEVGGLRFLRVVASSVIELDERGEEFVT